ncbi:MAG: quinone oxidoreductase [Actinomycetota bacterium]|nr:quinone oxidoreductase [Actinomycetota bacterium]
MRAIRVHRTGGPEVLTLEDVPSPEPGPGEAVIRLEAIGVNFIDVNHRSGAYEMALPFTPGVEGAGVVVAAAPDAGVAAGDHVGFARVIGAYAEEIAVPADRLVPLPDTVGTDVAASALLQGMTAHCLLDAAGQLRPGDWCVVHAAAGGVGLLLTQMASRRGLRVIGTASTAEKAERARAAGAEVTVVYTQHDFVEVAREVTEGRGVRAVFDAVGRDTFDKSIECLGLRGYMVLYGQTSGPPPPFDPRRLGDRSLFLTRAALADYVATREELLERSSAVLGAVARRELDVHVHERYPLPEAARAHRDLQSRKTTGKLLLIP